MTDNPKESAKEKKIAILGWGSLIWDNSANQEYDQQHGAWMSDGPVLNLEFSRKSTKSRAGALTLVIDPKHGVPCTVWYALSKQSDPVEAIEDLRRREGTCTDWIGRLFSKGANPDQKYAECGVISDWAERKGFDEVIWTALGGNFNEVSREDFVSDAIKYIQELNVEGKAKAAEYVWRAPEFAWTPLREALQREPWFALPK